MMLAFVTIALGSNARSGNVNEQESKRKNAKKRNVR
jgi:hypothetical protein